MNQQDAADGQASFNHFVYHQSEPKYSPRITSSTAVRTRQLTVLISLPKAYQIICCLLTGALCS